MQQIGPQSRATGEFVSFAVNILILVLVPLGLACPPTDPSSNQHNAQADPADQFPENACVQGEPEGVPEHNQQSKAAQTKCEKMFVEKGMLTDQKCWCGISRITESLNALPVGTTLDRPKVEQDFLRNRIMRTNHATPPTLDGTPNARNTVQKIIRFTCRGLFRRLAEVLVAPIGTSKGQWEDTQRAPLSRSKRATL